MDSPAVQDTQQTQAPPQPQPQSKPDPVDYRTDPSRYKHWRLTFEPPVATLTMDVAEDGGLRPGYKLKLNSYDLGVDIELYDALQRIRFEHPEIRTVVITSAKNRVFCSGANIYMLGLSSHAWKVNFCKFTNETRNGIEDSSANSGLKFLAALNGSTAGGGYELALACDDIVLIDDRSSAVSLPELPLLGVLPGTGGLTRVTDKRNVRRDHADIFCTNPDGVRGQRAKDWRLVDEIIKPQQFAEQIKQRAAKLAEQSDRPADAKGIALTPLDRTIDDTGVHYKYVDAQFNRAARTVTLTVKAPDSTPQLSARIRARPRRQLVSAPTRPRTRRRHPPSPHQRTRPRPLAHQNRRQRRRHHRHRRFPPRQSIELVRPRNARHAPPHARPPRRHFPLDVRHHRTRFLFRRHTLRASTGERPHLHPRRARSPRKRATRLRRPLKNKFRRAPHAQSSFTPASRASTTTIPKISALKEKLGTKLNPQEALDLGLVTVAPDDLDWEDELRQAIESRAALSPDGLTGLEANLRFGPNETLETRIFGRLSAWQNWIFIRPNAVGPDGALKVYGTGAPTKFNWERV